MTVVSLVGDFNVNGIPSVGMTVDTRERVTFNVQSGLVAVMAMSPEGKPIKGLAVATEPVLESINQLGNVAVRDESIRVPKVF